MPGIVGLVGDIVSNHNRGFIIEMAIALEPEDRFNINEYHGDMISIGRVSLDITNPGEQPIWNEDKTLCVLMEGELFDYQQSKDELIKKGHKFNLKNNDAEYLIHLYEEYGLDFVNKLNGIFIAAIWDNKSKKLMLINDRLGLHPMYYARLKDGIIFGSGVRSLLCEPSLPNHVDLVAIAEFLTFDHVLNDRTLLDGVRLLPQASILTFSDNQITIKKYWKIRYADPYLLRSEKELMEEMSYLIRQAVHRQKTHDDLASAILLSGGLDSRFLIPYLVEDNKHSQLQSFTFGIPGCNDERYARQISRILGVPHNFFEIKPDWLLNKATEVVRITDGMGNIVNLQAFATLEAETELAKIIYKGFLGDAMMGYGIQHQFWASYDESTTSLAHLQVHNDQNVITFDFEKQKNLFTKEFQNEVKTAVLNSYISGMKNAETTVLADQRNYFDFLQRVPRMTIKGVEVVRNRAVVRLPFTDNDLVEFSLTIPPGLRYQRRLMKNAFVYAFPKLAQIPVTETDLPMMSCGRDVIIRAKQVIQWHLDAHGFGWLQPHTHHHFTNYNNWFRGPLREWVEDILLSETCLQRGYYNPNYVQNLLDEHMRGINHTVRIGALTSIELWHKNFLD